MKNLKVKTTIKKLKVSIDKSLNQYENKVLFPEKLKKANDMLKNVGLPKKELFPNSQYFFGWINQNSFKAPERGFFYCLITITQKTNSKNTTSNF